jgi:hypothetical protein
VHAVAAADEVEMRPQVMQERVLRPVPAPGVAVAGEHGVVAEAVMPQPMPGRQLQPMRQHLQLRRAAVADEVAEAADAAGLHRRQRLCVRLLRHRWLRRCRLLKRSGTFGPPKAPVIR